MTARARATQAEIDDTAPVRLCEAAALAFPDGSMTVSGLRRERDKNRLAVFRIAGKEYTTLAAIREMIELCRAPQSQSACASKPRQTKDRSGTSLMVAAVSPQDAAKATLQALKNGLASTSRPDTKPNAGNVVLMKSR